VDSQAGQTAGGLRSERRRRPHPPPGWWPPPNNGLRRGGCRPLLQCTQAVGRQIIRPPENSVPPSMQAIEAEQFRWVSRQRRLLDAHGPRGQRRARQRLEPDRHTVLAKLGQMLSQRAATPQGQRGVSASIPGSRRAPESPHQPGSKLAIWLKQVGGDDPVWGGLVLEHLQPVAFWILQVERSRCHRGGHCTGPTLVGCLQAAS